MVEGKKEGRFSKTANDISGTVKGICWGESCKLGYIFSAIS